jgi:hypothetical protein
MIVVVGSRHDTVAAALVSRWPGAALCSAEDLCSPGWRWSMPGATARRWIVAGQPVRDEDVSGVFLRRSAVYAEEMVSLHPADRGFAAAEAHGFLSCVLATSAARVVNPVRDGAFGEEAVRPECWAAAARRLGLPLAPQRVASAPIRRAALRRRDCVECAAGQAFGPADTALRAVAGELSQALGLVWAVIAFDRQRRLLGVSVAAAPGEGAQAALGRALAEGRP